MATTTPRHYIVVSPPTVAAGVGDALRRAYNGPELRRPMQMFERLIERLDRLD